MTQKEFLVRITSALLRNTNLERMQSSNADYSDQEQTVQKKECRRWKQHADMERYRSGHNEAVLKTVCPQGRVGSNPTLSAGDTFSAELVIQLI